MFVPNGLRSGRRKRALNRFGGPYVRIMTRGEPLPDGRLLNRALATWLLLLSIFTHAFVPLGATVQAASGSAFAASTAEVSLAPRRLSLPGKAQAQLRAREDGGSAGPSGDTPGFPLPFAPAIPPAGSSLVAAPFPAAPVRAPAPSASPFSARAPPAS